MFRFATLVIQIKFRYPTWKDNHVLTISDENNVYNTEKIEEKRFCLTCCRPLSPKETGETKKTEPN